MTQMMGIGLQCNCPRKPDEDLEAKLPDLQHVRPSNQLLEKNHVDAAPLFEWVNSECPILQGELFDWDDQRRQTRRSYYDLRLDPKQGGAGEPNRALHDFKACELKSFVRKVHRSPGILEDLVRKKRDATWGEEKPTATGTRGFSRKLGTLIHRSFDS